MSLNNLKPNPGSRKNATRVGRGIGSGSGKTGGRGHKGQKARSGGFHKVGFEGGQMPIQRRLPKFGFTSRMGRHYAEVRLHELAKVPEGDISPATLIEAGIVPLQTRTVKIILAGEIGTAVTIKGCRVTKGARSAIEAAGGSIDDTPAPTTGPKPRGEKGARKSRDTASGDGSAAAATGGGVAVAGETASGDAGTDAPRNEDSAADDSTATPSAD